jgi:hypothetical protein
VSGPSSFCSLALNWMHALSHIGNPSVHFGRWSGSRATNFQIKLRACQGDDTMMASRHRHVVPQTLCDVRKILLVPQLTSLSSVANCFSR